MDAQVKPTQRICKWKERECGCDDKCKLIEGTTYILLTTIWDSNSKAYSN